MKAGQFNIHEYLQQLNESADAGSVKDSGEGQMIPDGESKKAYDWLKKEYKKGKVEVKVEMKMGGQKFEPHMDFQTDQKSIKNFKAGIFGEIKTSDTEGSNNKEAAPKKEAESTQESSDEKKAEKPVAKEDAKKSAVKIQATTKKKKEEDED